MSKRMKLLPSEISELSKKSNKKRIEEGTHNFLDGEFHRKIQLKRISEGTHHFQNKEWAKKRSKKVTDEGKNPFSGGEIQRKTQNKRVKEGTHNLLGPEMNKKQIELGKHNFLKENQILYECNCGCEKKYNKGNFSQHKQRIMK